MRRVVILAEAAADLEEAREFYNAREAGVGDYCVASLLADIESLALYHGIHRQQHGCYRTGGNQCPRGRRVSVAQNRRAGAWPFSRLPYSTALRRSLCLAEAVA